MSPYLRRLRAHVGHQLVLVPSVTAVVTDDDAGQVVLVRSRDTGCWVLPGGAIDPGESPADAVVRETWEETGLVVEPVRLCGVWGGRPEFRITYANGDVVEYVMTVFACRRLDGALRPDGEEILEARTAPVVTLGGDPTVAAWVHPILADVFRAHGPHGFDPPTRRTTRQA